MEYKTDFNYRGIYLIATGTYDGGEWEDVGIEIAETGEDASCLLRDDVYDKALVEAIEYLNETK